MKKDNKEERDILKLKIPNVCFSNDDGKMKESKLYEKERIKNGFDDTEIANLGMCIARYVYPRLVQFRKSHIGYPSCIEYFNSPYSSTDKYAEIYMEKWNLILDKMIKAFHIYLYEMNDDWNTKEEYENLEEKCNEGMHLFAKYIGCLYI